MRVPDPRYRHFVAIRRRIAWAVPENRETVGINETPAGVGDTPTMRVTARTLISATR